MMRESFKLDAKDKFCEVDHIGLGGFGQVNQPPLAQ